MCTPTHKKNPFRPNTQGMPVCSYRYRILRQQICKIFSRAVGQKLFILCLSIGQMLKSYFPYMIEISTSISLAVTVPCITTNSSVVLLAPKSSFYQFNSPGCQSQEKQIGNTSKELATKHSKALN